MDLNNSSNSTITVAFIGETVKPDDQKTFIKREIAFNIAEEVNGNVYNRLMCMQATGDSSKPQFDKTKMLDSYGIGDVVNIKFGISGSSKKNDKLSPTTNNPDCLTGFNNLSVSSIELVRKAGQPMGYQPQAQTAYQPQPNYQPQQAQSQPQAQPAQNVKPFYPQPAGAVPQDENQQPLIWNTTTGQWEKLPF